MMYSQTFTNGHLSATAASFILAEDPYICFYFNLPTTATASKTGPQLPK